MQAQYQENNSKFECLYRANVPPPNIRDNLTYENMYITFPIPVYAAREWVNDFIILNKLCK